MSDEDKELSNKELYDKCNILVDDFCKNGKKSKLWYMSIPARPNSDADLLFSKLLNRFNSHLSKIDELEEQIVDTEEALTGAIDCIHRMKCCGNCKHQNTYADECIPCVRNENPMTDGDNWTTTD